MNRFGEQSSPYIDQVASNLRSQIVSLHNILESIERTHHYGDDYVIRSLREVEVELRSLRKFIDT